MPATVNKLRLIADYQLFSESEGHGWMTQTLTEARDQGLICDFQVTGSYPGAFGIQLVTFTVDVPLGQGLFTEDLTYDEARVVAGTFLNEHVVHDSDVSLRWLSPLPQET